MTISGAFALPAGVCYLNAASSGPLPEVVRQAGIAGISSKSQPWTRDWAAAAQQTGELRGLAAERIGAQSSDVAVITAVSYGIATICATHRPAPGSRFLVPAGEHTSLTLGLARHAGLHGCTLEFVQPTHGDDWTAAFAEALLRPGAPVSLAGLTPLHWASGALIDLASLIPMVHRQGGVALVDSTQAAGVMPIDVATLDPDWLIFPTYKWLLGPYHLAFLYVAPRHQNVEPLEQHIGNRQDGNPALMQDSSKLAYLAGASRFDAGEPDTFAAIPMGLAALQFLGSRSTAEIGSHIAGLTNALVNGVASLPLQTVEDRFRAPHIVALRGPAAIAETMTARLAAHQVHVSVRHGMIRLSPHIYNSEADIAQCLAALGQEFPA